MPNKPKKKVKIVNAEFWATSETAAEAHLQHGTPVEVVTIEKAEQADVVVCAYAGEEQEQFKIDNIYTTCVDCGKDITHRPHAPKNPPKVCMPCAIIRMQKDAEGSCDKN